MNQNCTGSTGPDERDQANGADFVIGSLLPDHQTAMAFATNHSIPVGDGDSAPLGSCTGLSR